MNTKQLALSWFDSVWNQKRPSTISEMMDASVVGVTEGGELRGPDQFREMMYEPFLAAFPDLHVEVTACISDGNEAAVKWSATATHKGSLMHLPPSGRRVKFHGMTWLTFDQGKIISGSDSFNFHGLVSYLERGTPCASVSPM